MLLRLAGFTGMWPVRDPRALPDNAAVDAININVDGGAYLKGARGHFQRVSPLGVNFASAYPIKTQAISPWANTWMFFADVNTDVLKAPIVNDSFERYYWASPTSNGLRFATRNDILSGAWQTGGYIVGVPPITATTMQIIPVAGTGTTTGPKATRAYVVTHVNVYGEESTPSRPAEGTGFVDQEWRVQDIPQPAVGGSFAPISTMRLYRTITDVTGITDYFKVTDLPVGTTVYIDRLSDLTVSGNNKLGSTYFDKPPPLVGVVSLPNGIFVGWGSATPRDVYISDNYRPHSWPEGYKVTVDHPIVGMGVFGNSVVICTEGEPAIISGTQASAMSLTKVGSALPCLSRRSIVDAPEGVYYASDSGLVLIGPQGVNVVTQGLYSTEQWLNDIKPETLRAAYSRGEYIALQYGTAGGVRFKPANPSAQGVIRWTGPPTHGNPVNVGVEPYFGKPYIIGPFLNWNGSVIWEWENPTQPLQSYTWRSKEIQVPFPCNFSVGQIYFDDTLGSAINLTLFARLRAADGTVARQQVYNGPITRSGSEFRLTSGFKSDIWEVLLEGNASLQSFQMASSVAELRSA